MACGVENNVDKTASNANIPRARTEVTIVLMNIDSVVPETPAYCVCSTKVSAPPSM